jgi:paraquat-inducible protein A
MGAGRTMSQELIACHDCDLLQTVVEPPVGGTGRCGRCGGTLYQNKRDSVDRTLALVLASLVLFLVANTFPFLAFDMSGNVTQTTLSTGVQKLWEQDMGLMAGLVLVTAILAPLTHISLLLYLLVPIKLDRTPWQLARVFRLLRRVEPWSMMEVFLIGILVSLVKLADMAEIIPGLAIWSFGLLILFLSGAVASLDPRVIWSRAEVRQ